MPVDGESQSRLPPVHEAWLPREHSLHRPRHGSRQGSALVCALVFFSLPTMLWLSGVRPTEIENHRLAAFPSASQGWDFFAAFDSWATDNLPFRAGAVQSMDWISRALFAEPPRFDLGGSPQTGPLAGGQSPADDPNDPPGEQDHAGYRRVIEGTSGWMYFGQDIVSKCQPNRSVDETVRQLRRLREAVEASGRRFMLVAVPDKTTAVPENLPSSYPRKSCADAVTPELWRKVTNVPRTVDLRPALKAVASDIGRPPYFPTDSHWTDEGALELVKAVAERAKPGVTRNWSVGRKARYSGAADLPPLIGRTGEKTGYNYTLAPDGRRDRSEPTVYDLAKPVHRTSTPGAGMVTTPTVVLGDSFIIACTAYLPAAFADVTMVSYLTIQTDPGAVVSTIADSEVVVFEVVERNIAAGTPPMLAQPFIDLLRQELAKRPVG